MILFDLKSLGTLTTGFLIKRQNRFLATVKVDEKIQKAHIADTGRLEEILTPNRELLLLKNRDGLKTDFTLIAAKMEEGWVLINTKLHPVIAGNAIENGVLGFKPKELKREVKFLNSRFDYYFKTSKSDFEQDKSPNKRTSFSKKTTSKSDFEVEGFVELKGCSLVEDGFCLFPNAPTSRGVKHIKELIEAKKKGYESYILIMAVRKCRCFKPHPTRDEEFKKIFYKALKEGVKFRGFFVKIDEDLKVVYNGELWLCED